MSPTFEMFTTRRGGQQLQLRESGQLYGGNGVEGSMRECGLKIRWLRVRNLSPLQFKGSIVQTAGKGVTSSCRFREDQGKPPVAATPRQGAFKGPRCRTKLVNPGRRLIVLRRGVALAPAASEQPTGSRPREQRAASSHSSASERSASAPAPRTRCWESECRSEISAAAGKALH